MKNYIIKLNDEVIGKTNLESADAPMGVVSGKITFINSISGFEFVKNFCQSNGCEINELDEKYQFIDTKTIEQLKVFREDGVEIKGIGYYITGMDSEGFEITILGIPYPFYEQEFPHHVKNGEPN